MPGSDVCYRDDKAESVVNAAAKSGHWDCVRVLIDEGADVTCADEDGHTLLHWAAKYGEIEIAAIIEELAPGEVQRTRQTKKYCWTPLHIAAAEGRAQMCRWLVLHGIDTDVRNKRGQTASVVAQRVCPVRLNEGRKAVCHAVRSVKVTGEVGQIKERTAQATTLLSQLAPTSETQGLVFKELVESMASEVIPLQDGSVRDGSVQDGSVITTEEEADDAEALKAQLEVLMGLYGSV